MRMILFIYEMMFVSFNISHRQTNSKWEWSCLSTRWCSCRLTFPIGKQTQNENDPVFLGDDVVSFNISDRQTNSKWELSCLSSKFLFINHSLERFFHEFCVFFFFQKEYYLGCLLNILRILTSWFHMLHYNFVSSPFIVGANILQTGTNYKFQDIFLLLYSQS